MLLTTVILFGSPLAAILCGRWLARRRREEERRQYILQLVRDDAQARIAKSLQGRYG